MSKESSLHWTQALFLLYHCVINKYHSYHFVGVCVTVSQYSDCHMQTKLIIISAKDGSGRDINTSQALTPITGVRR